VTAVRARVVPAALAALAALAIVPSAAAHVVVSPAFVQSEATESIDLTGPNERDVPMTGFAVTVPDGLDIVHAHGPDGWEASIAGRTATWNGGTVAAGAEATFGLVLDVTADPGTVELQAQQRYRDGVVRWPISLTVTPAAEGPSENLALAGVVGLIGALVIAAGATLAWRRRAG
jgi:uncharacterized protein YcnI